VLFIWLSWSIYRDIKEQPNLPAAWQEMKNALTGDRLIYLVLAILLTPVNYGFEAWKWKLCLQPVQRIRFWQAYKAVLSGHALGFNTVNRMGDPAGRVLFLSEGKRIQGMVQFTVAGFSQILTILILGLYGLLYFRFKATGVQLENIIPRPWPNIFIGATVIAMLVFILLLFRLSWLLFLLQKIPFIAKRFHLFEKLDELDKHDLTGILFLSGCRVVVYTVQNVFLLFGFGVITGFGDACSMVFVMYLILALIPTINMAELGIRGKLSLQLFGLLSTNYLGIVSAATGIWLINLLIPAMAGTLFVLNIKLFRKNHKA